MKSIGPWLTGAVSLTLLATAAAPGWAQQNDSADDQASQDCVCVDTAGVRRQAMEQARRAMARARMAMRRAGRRFQDIDLVMPARARLGVGIDYAQGPRWDSVGARVLRVPERGPAAGAGLKEGDVIVALDGHPLTEPLSDESREQELDPDRSLPVQRLTQLLARHEPGDTVRVAYRRDGQESTTQVRLGAGPAWMGAAPGSPRAPRPDDAPRPLRFRTPGPDGSGFFRSPPGTPRAPERAVPSGWREACRELPRSSSARPANCMAGVTVAGLNPQLGHYFGTEDGVLVLDVAESSKLGLEPGDVVLSVNGRAVHDPRDLRRILASYRSDEEVHFHVRRQGAERDIEGTAP